MCEYIYYAKNIAYRNIAYRILKQIFLRGANLSTFDISLRDY